MKNARDFRRASALLLVLWALLVLSAAVFGWAVSMQASLAQHGAANRATEARAMAHSGMAVALHPRVQLETPLPEETVAPGQSYRVKVVSEGGKLNLPWLLRGEEPRKILLLKQWLERRGLDFEQREVFVDCVLDYIDGDDLHRLNGREKEDGYEPANRDLRSVRELALIAGTEPLTSQPGWDDELTIYSQGPLDLGSASIDLLKLLPGLGETAIRQFVQYRQGKDALDGTPDDIRFANLAAIQKFLGLNAAQFKELAGLVTYKDPTLHITSLGRSSTVTRQVEVIVNKSGGKAGILHWKE